MARISMTLRSLLRLRRSVKHIAGCERELTRIADCLEAICAHEGVSVKAEGKPETFVAFTDEEAEARAEMEQWMKEQYFGHREMVPKEGEMP